MSALSGVPIEDYQKEALKKLGARIKQLRKAAGYRNAEKFAFEHDISRSQYTRYENGEDLRYSSLVKLTNAFGLSLAEFFSEGFDDTSDPKNS